MNSKFLLMLVTVVLLCLSGFSSDIYAPVQNIVAKDLNAHINTIQSSMAIYMLGIAISLLFYGPISEGIGRKGPILTGLMIMLIGTVICFFAQSATIIIIGRFVQGLGAGASNGLWRSIFRDSFSGSEMAKYGSMLTLIVIFVVPAAPIIGAFIEHLMGWRAIFGFIFIYVAAALILLVLLYKETSEHHHRDRLKLRFIKTTYKEVFSNKIFIGASLCSFFTFGALFTWFISGSVTLIKYAGITPTEFGWLSLVGCGLAYGIAGQINAKLVEKRGMDTMMRLGFKIMTISGILLTTGFFIFGVTALAIIIPVICFSFGATFIFPTAFARAMTPFGHIAGYAGTTYSFLQILGATVLGFLLAHLPESNQVILGIVFTVCPAIAWILYERLVVKVSQQ